MFIIITPYLLLENKIQYLPASGYFPRNFPFLHNATYNFMPNIPQCKNPSRPISTGDFFRRLYPSVYSFRVLPGKDLEQTLKMLCNCQFHCQSWPCKKSTNYLLNVCQYLLASVSPVFVYIRRCGRWSNWGMSRYKSYTCTILLARTWTFYLMH